MRRQINEYNKIIEQVEKSPKKNKIVIIRSVSNPYSFIDKCDGMIISSYYEGLPMVLYEAIVLNKPVVSTEIPTIKKFFETFARRFAEISPEYFLSVFVSTPRTESSFATKRAFKSCSISKSKMIESI